MAVTNEQFTEKAYQIAKFNDVKVSKKNIVLLESGNNGDKIDYIMFRDDKTKKEYQVRVMELAFSKGISIGFNECKY